MFCRQSEEGEEREARGEKAKGGGKAKLPVASPPRESISKLCNILRHS